MIFVTGATGSIGGHLVRILATRGVKAKALVRKAEDGQRLHAMGHWIAGFGMGWSPSTPTSSPKATISP